MYICIRTFISFIAGKSALPDIYTRVPEDAQRPRACMDISGEAQLPAI